MNLLVLNGFPAIDRKNVVARCPEMTENAKFSPERQKLWRSLSGSIRSCGFLPGFFRIVKCKYALLARLCFLSHRVRFPPHLPSIPTLVGANKLAGCGGLFCMPANLPRNPGLLTVYLQEYTGGLTGGILAWAGGRKKCFGELKNTRIPKGSRVIVYCCTRDIKSGTVAGLRHYVLALVNSQRRRDSRLFVEIVIGLGCTFFRFFHFSRDRHHAFRFCVRPQCRHWHYPLVSFSAGQRLRWSANMLLLH